MTDDARYLHLVPSENWAAQAAGQTYVPDGFDREGFIHLTIGAENVIEVANRYYRQDPRAYSVLVLDKDRITARVQFDDDSGRYPHVYGPLNTDAVVAVHPVMRDEDGSFVGIEFTETPA